MYLGHLRRGGLQALYLWAFQKWCSETFINRASPGIPSETPYPRGFQRRFQGRRPAIARQRFLCVERIHLTFATASACLAVLVCTVCGLLSCLWQSRVAIGRCCKRGARKPASTGHSRGGRPEVLYLRGFQSICVGDALSTRGPEAPLRKASGNARQRFLCLSRIHLTFATALLHLAVLLVLFAACRLVSKINSIRYMTSGRFFTRRCGSYPAVGCLSQPTPIKFRPRQSGASRLAGWRRTNWSCQRRPSPPSCRNAPSA